MNQKKSRFERYSNGILQKEKKTDKSSHSEKNNQRDSINQVLNGNLTFENGQVEQKFQRKISYKLINMNRFSLLNIIAYYFVKIIQNLSDTDREISDLIYFIIIFFISIGIQISYIISMQRQIKKQQSILLYMMSCVIYLNILQWQKYYLKQDISNVSNSCSENLEALIIEYQIVFLMFFWIKWFWKCITLIGITVFQSVFLFESKYSQSLGIFLMMIQIIVAYITEYSNRASFIHQNQKCQNLKQLVEIMNTKLPCGVAIFQKKHISNEEQQNEQIKNKNDQFSDYNQNHFQTQGFKTGERMIQTEKDINIFKQSLDQIISPSSEKKAQFNLEASLLVQSEQEEQQNLEIRFINNTLFQQILSSNNGNKIAQQCLIKSDEYQQKMNQQNINSSKSKNIYQYQLINGSIMEQNNLYMQQDSNKTAEFNNNNNNNNNFDKNSNKQTYINLKDNNTIQYIHSFLEQLQVPSRSGNTNSNNFNIKSEVEQNKHVYKFNNMNDGQADGDFEDSIGFYTNFAEIKNQQNKRQSQQKTNFKQLIFNLFQIYNKDQINISNKNQSSIDKVYFNCQQIIERPRQTLERKETKPDIGNRNGTDDSLKQYDIKITSVMLNGEPALILMINDSTDRFFLQQMKESSEFKSQLLNYIQHIAKTPLNSIIQLSETMEQWFPLQPNNKQIGKDIKDNLDIIKKNGLILHHQVQSIIDLQQINCNSKISLKTDLIDLYTVIKEVEELFQTEIEAKNIKFDIVQEEENVEMQTDENRLVQILIEMIGNSVKFTRESDSIKIEIRQQKTYSVSLISISIIDTGSGMTPEQVAIINSSASLENIAMTNTHFRQGPGIGLEVSRKLIGLLGPFSKFNLKSTLGEGSTFKFWLYSNLNEKELAEKNNKMMRKTSDLILEKKELHSFDKFVISNKLQHMEIMVDPFSLLPQMMYSNKDLNHYLQTRKSSKISASSSYSPKCARTTDGGLQHNQNTQLTQIQNQFLQEQQILQAQIMKKRSLYKMNYSPNLVIRKRDMTINTYNQEQIKYSLGKYLKLNNEQYINQSESIQFSNSNNNNASPPNNNNSNNKQKTQISLPSDNLDNFLRPFRKFGRKHTLQVKDAQSNGFKRTNRKFLSNSYQINIGSYNSINSQKSKQSNIPQQNKNKQNSKEKFPTQNVSFFSLINPENSKKDQYCQYFPHQSSNTKGNKLFHRSESLYPMKTNELLISSKEIKEQSQAREEDQDVEDILDEEKEEEVEEQSEEEEIEEENENEQFKQEESLIGDITNNQENNIANEPDLQIYESRKQKQKILSHTQQDDLQKMINNESYSCQKQKLDKTHINNKSNCYVSNQPSQLDLGETEEFNQLIQQNQIRKFQTKSNHNILYHQNLKISFDQNKNPSHTSCSAKKQDQLRSQFTFNTIRNCQSNISRHSMQEIGQSPEYDLKQSIISLRSNKPYSKCYDKSQYHSLTSIPSPELNSYYQTPLLIPKYDQIIEIDNTKQNQFKLSDNHSKVINLQNTLFKYTLEEEDHKKVIVIPELDLTKECDNPVKVKKNNKLKSQISFQLPSQCDSHSKISDIEDHKKEESQITEINECQITKYNQGDEDTYLCLNNNSNNNTNINKNNKIINKNNKNMNKQQQFSKNIMANKQSIKGNIIESLDMLERDNISKEDSKDTNNHSDCLTIPIKINRGGHELEVPPHSSQQLDEQKVLKIVTPPQQQKQFLNNQQVVTSRSSLGKQQLRVTINTIMSHDIDQDIFDTLFPSDTLLLIVDDTTFNRIVLKQMFKSSQNLIIHEAINGQDAIEKIKILKETTNRTYNLIFMDLNMPIMDGFECLKTINNLVKQNYINRVPVVAVTAYDTEVENCRKQGFDGFISKPIRIKEMVRTLIRIISIRKVEEL